jgi:hypothetical protein
MVNRRRGSLRLTVGLPSRLCPLEPQLQCSAMFFPIEKWAAESPVVRWSQRNKERRPETRSSNPRH